MQCCQRLEADYGMDPWVWQSLDGPSFHLSTKLCLCISFHGCFVPNSKKGQSVHTLVFVLLEFHEFSQIVSYILGILSIWANIHLSVSAYHVRICQCLENTEVDAYSPPNGGARKSTQGAEGICSPIEGTTI